MNIYNYKIARKQMLGDLYTPVSAYLRLRDLYTQSALMESSDYHSGENGRSFIAICPIAQVSIGHGMGRCSFPDGMTFEHAINRQYRSDALISHFLQAFHVEGEEQVVKDIQVHTCWLWEIIVLIERC